MDLYTFSAAKRLNETAVLEQIVYRWSPRRMTGEVLTPEELRPLLEAAHWAPSSFNNQPWRFYYALRDTAAFTDLFNLLVEKNQQWCRHAGCLMIVVSKTTFDHNGKPMGTHAYDTGSAWMALALEGIRRGYVVHGMAGFDSKAAAEYLKLTDEYHVNAMAAVGKPEPGVQDEDISLRKTVDEIAIAL